MYKLVNYQTKNINKLLQFITNYKLSLKFFQNVPIYIINKAFNSKGEVVNLEQKHGFTISRTDSKFVYFIDPNVGVEEYHISIEDFYKAFDTCAIASL